MKTLFGTMAMLLMGAAMISCSNIDDAVEHPVVMGKQVYTLSVDASKGSDNTTRALTPGAHSLAPSWKAGETLAVYGKHGDDYSKVGELVSQGDGVSVTFKGEVDLSSGSVTESDVLANGLKLCFPDSERDFTGQDGTLETIAARYDYAEGAVAISSFDHEANSLVVNEAASVLIFQNLTSIVKFSLTDNAATPAAVSPTLFSISAKSGETESLPIRILDDGTATYGKLTINTTGTASEFYAAVPPLSGKDITLTAITASGETYSYTRPNVSFVSGKYYEINVKMHQDFEALHTPLTIEAVNSGAITLVNKASGSVTYKVNDGEALTIAAGSTGIINVTANDVHHDVVTFYGDNAAYATSGVDGYYSTISCSADAYVYGNIMSLVSSTDYAAATSFSTNRTFYGLFKGNIHLMSHDSKALVLPATTLTQYCYSNMFYGCSSLAVAPELPAQTMKVGCYGAMFYNCARLTVAPALPATTLASCCYEQMFEGCTSLTVAPALPATTLAQYCYSKMFEGCTNLATPPAEIPAASMPDRACFYMFSGCTSLKAAPVLSATTLNGNECYSYMFKGCTSLKAAPALPATTLAQQCYEGMFYNYY